MTQSIDICIVNYNCLQHTRNLIEGILQQNFTNYTIWLYDQGSHENGTTTYLEQCANSGIHVIQNGHNKHLNRIWNEFAKNATADIISYLNNDILIPVNFLHDIVETLRTDSTVGVVTHVTNNTQFKVNVEATTVHNYRRRVRQGWDFSLHRVDWVDIPDSLKIYCGDDWVFDAQYDNGKTISVITSSPMIHLLSQTTLTMSADEQYTVRQIAESDMATYRNMRPHIWNNIPHISNIEPPGKQNPETHSRGIIHFDTPATSRRIKHILTELRGITGDVVAIQSDNIAAKTYCHANSEIYRMICHTELTASMEIKCIVISEEFDHLHAIMQTCYSHIMSGGIIIIPWYEAGTIPDKGIFTQFLKLYEGQVEVIPNTGDDISLVIRCHKNIEYNAEKMV